MIRSILLLFIMLLFSCKKLTPLTVVNLNVSLNDDLTSFLENHKHVIAFDNGGMQSYKFYVQVDSLPTGSSGSIIYGFKESRLVFVQGNIGKVPKEFLDKIFKQKYYEEKIKQGQLMEICESNKDKLETVKIETSLNKMFIVYFTVVRYDLTSDFKVDTINCN